MADERRGGLLPVELAAMRAVTTDIRNKAHTTPRTMRALPAARPMCWRRAFPGKEEQIAAVRQFASFLLADCSLQDGAVLVLSELATNATRWSESNRVGGLIIVQVTRWPRAVQVAVTDQGGPRYPIPRCADRFEESGRGLAMVAGLASRWGWHGSSEGRTVWAEMVMSRLKKEIDK